MVGGGGILVVSTVVTSLNLLVLFLGGRLQMLAITGCLLMLMGWLV